MMPPNPNFGEIQTTTLRNRSAAMPVGPTRTKAQKQRVVHTEMHKFGQGKLHSGSKHGPVVTNPKQAVAISLHESHQSKPPSERKGYARADHHKEHFGR
jgi:hypothetical protein